jgi:threonine synthase
MNVGHPSNMSRLIALYGGTMNEKGIILQDPHRDQIKEDMYSVSINDDRTREMIADAYEKHNLLLEPHGSVAWAGLMNYLNEHKEDDHADQICIALETAHPAKFPEQILEILSLDPELPPSLEGIEQKDEFFIKMNNEYAEFKDFLLKRFK